MTEEVVNEEVVNEEVTPTETTAETPVELTGHQQFLEMLPEDLRAEPMFRDFDGDSAAEAVGKLGKSYMNTKKLVGADKAAILKIPSSEEDADGWNAVYSKMGRPDEVAGYGVDKYKDIPGIKEESLNGFAEMAHKKGFSTAQADAVLGFYREQIGDADVKSVEEVEAMQKGFDTELRTEYGDAYEQKTAKVVAAVKEHASDELLEMASEMPWIFDSPAFVKFVDSMVKSSSEDGGPKQASSASQGNMTPDEAKAEIAAMDDDPTIMKALMDQGNPRRQEILAKRTKLFSQAYPA